MKQGKDRCINMLHPTNFREKQKAAILHQLYEDHSMLWLNCGFGKTVATLTSIEHRMRAGQVKKTIVFGPVRVIHAVWERESRKWSHLDHLRFSIIGWPTEKKRRKGLNTDADVYLCNYENMGWLSTVLWREYIQKGLEIPFQFAVYVEITQGKNSTSLRVAGGNRKRVYNKGLANEIKKNIYTAGWRKIIPYIKYTTGLTGTPAGNGYLDLHGQYLLIDNGERLGTHKTGYEEAYFTTGYNGYTKEITKLGKAWIEQKISDITIQMESGGDEEIFCNDIMVDLPPKVMEQYEQVEKDMYTVLDNGSEIELFNRASVSNKCLQMASGAPYVAPNEPEWYEVHDEKLQALDSVIEETHGRTLLLGYNFRSDAERIMKRYKALSPINLTATKPEDFTKILALGNAGKVRLMIGHPKSLGHGVDGLNDFCWDICWFGLPWSLEGYMQLIGRIAAGERYTRPVNMHRILARGTLDLAVSDALSRKDGDQNGLRRSIQRHRDGLLSPDGVPCFM